MFGKFRVVLAFVTLISGMALQGSARAEEPLVGSLHVGTYVFWNGGSVGSDPTYSLPTPRVSALDRCSMVGPCFAYKLKLYETGADLRVALSTLSRDDGFEIVVYAPDGTVAASFSNNNQYNTETFIAAPVAGTYRITVAPYSADFASFKMRAKLESSAYVPAPDANGYLLPDLRVTRLWEFGFIAPANPLNGLFPPDDSNPPLDVSGVHPLSCGLDEMADDGVSRCLRFSFGLANVGTGNFDIRFNSDRTGAPTRNVQCLQRASGAPVARDAGTSSFHQTHGHYHFQDVIYHRIYRVTSRSAGTMTLAGSGQKLGYSPADQSFPEWSRFIQAPNGTSGSAGTCAPTLDNRLGLSRGWGDAYRYQRPGNYVDFNTNSDGYYVVTTTADPKNVIKESDDSNNTSYAYLRIEGEKIDVIESGIGSSPWDPDKELFS